MKNFTLVGPSRINKIKEFCKLTKNVPGDIIEVGVYKGGTAQVLAEETTGKKIYLCDTFQGIPYQDKTIDHHRVGDFGDVNYTDILNFAQQHENIVVLTGIFPKDTGVVVKDSKFSLVHLDVDVYQSYIECLNFLY